MILIKTDIPHPLEREYLSYFEVFISLAGKLIVSDLMMVVLLYP
jgi:hypothetical protein